MCLNWDPSVSQFIKGYVATSLFGYYFPDWRDYSIAMALHNGIGVVTYFFIPESFSFLYRSGKYEQGREVIKLFATKTRTDISEEYLNWFHQEAIKSKG